MIYLAVETFPSIRSRDWSFIGKVKPFRSPVRAGRGRHDGPTSWSGCLPAWGTVRNATVVNSTFKSAARRKDKATPDQDISGPVRVRVFPYITKV